MSQPETRVKLVGRPISQLLGLAVDRSVDRLTCTTWTTPDQRIGRPLGRPSWPIIGYARPFDRPTWAKT